MLSLLAEADGDVLLEVLGVLLMPFRAGKLNAYFTASIITLRPMRWHIEHLNPADI